MIAIIADTARLPEKVESLAIDHEIGVLTVADLLTAVLNYDDIRGQLKNGGGPSGTGGGYRRPGDVRSEAAAKIQATFKVGGNGVGFVVGREYDWELLCANTHSAH